MIPGHQVITATEYEQDPDRWKGYQVIKLRLSWPVSTQLNSVLFLYCTCFRTALANALAIMDAPDPKRHHCFLLLVMLVLGLLLQQPKGAHWMRTLFHF